MAWTPGLRLPPETRWWWWAAEAACALRLVYGSIPSPALEVLGAPGVSEAHPYTGDDVYIQFQAALGTRIWIMWSP